EINALTDNDLYRIRSVSGVKWAVPLFEGQPRAKAPDGKFRVVILLGLDDATLVGAPRKMILGAAEDLRQPDAAIIDEAGYRFFFPNQPLQLGKILEMNDHRARLVGICDASAPFTTFPVLFTRYSQALRFVGRERNLLLFVLVKPEPNVPIAELIKCIAGATGLKAMSSEQFGWATIMYFIRNTGIPVNFWMTVMIALIVGTVVAGQTFYIFTLENLKQFGALKAIGITNRRIVGMILLQALVVGGIGYALGMGMAATFFAIFVHRMATRGIILLPEVMIGTAVIVIFIVVVASLMSIRKVLVLEPAVVFRG
ncbi:MAG: ABC transporter permease, partial [Acidobacteria bacterium]